ncbi:MAG: hypothetical protein AAFX93_13310 [Verrucomicrobiota bacterium]
MATDTATASKYEIGVPPWTYEELREAVDEFDKIHAQRPIRENQGGTRASHMFAIWFIARKLQPEFIVESGIWKGQSTWLLEQACPKAHIVSLDIHLVFREYISDRVEYHERDFSQMDWSGIPENNLAFFDDHQNALARLQQCVWNGFRNVIFDDNYPIGLGDCYSMRKVLADAGHQCPQEMNPRKRGLSERVLRRLLYEATKNVKEDIQVTPQVQGKNSIEPNERDAKLVRKWADVYAEYPPIFEFEKNRFNRDWNSPGFEVHDAILGPKDQAKYPDLYAEGTKYGWICYLHLRDSILGK